MKILRYFGELFAKGLIGLIRAYQFLISPEKSFWGKGRDLKICRFYPTCSDYAIGSLKEHGIFKGVYLLTKRVMRCHPWHPGGFDPVPKKKK